jgi:hypothetical protein
MAGMGIIGKVEVAYEYPLDDWLSRRLSHLVGCIYSSRRPLVSIAIKQIGGICTRGYGGMTMG